MATRSARHDAWVFKDPEWVDDVMVELALKRKRLPRRMTKGEKLAVFVAVAEMKNGNMNMACEMAKTSGQTGRALWDHAVQLVTAARAAAAQ